jgi:hypothetical protein
MPTPQDYIARSNGIFKHLNEHGRAGAPVTNHVVAAGKEAVEALGQLLEDQTFWNYLRTKRPPDDVSADVYADDVVKYHALVLEKLNHVPPPSAHELAHRIRDAIINNRGGDTRELDEVRQHVIALKDSTQKLVDNAGQVMAKPAQLMGAPKAKSIGSRLVQAGRDICTLVSTVASVLALQGSAAPPLTPPTVVINPPPIVLVLPAPPSGAADFGCTYLYRGLPPLPPDDPPAGRT